MTGQTFHLAIADLVLAIETTGPLDPARVRARMGAFFVEPQQADIHLALDVVPGFGREQPTAVAWPGCLAEWSRAAQTSEIRYLRSDLEMVYTPAEKGMARARATTSPSNSRLPPVKDPTPLDTPLRLLVSHALTRGRGLLVHAAGCAGPKGALLFAGCSGAGKTTTARKLPYDRVLSDDLVAIKEHGTGRFVAYATPFVGEYGLAMRPQSSRLAHVFFLEKSAHLAANERAGADGQARTPGASDALMRLGRCVAQFVRKEPSSGDLLGRVARLLDVVPTTVLPLGKETPIVPILEREALWT